MIFYKGLNLVVNEKYNYTEYTFVNSDLEIKNFIRTISLITEYLLYNKTKYYLLNFSRRFIGTSSHIIILKQIILPQLIKYGIVDIIVNIEPALVKISKKLFKDYSFIQFVGNKEAAIIWMQNRERIKTNCLINE